MLESNIEKKNRNLLKNLYKKKSKFQSFTYKLP